jgi:hypothetical protein
MDLSCKNLLDVSGADSRLDHHGRIGIDLDGLAPSENIPLEMQRDVQ